VQRRPRILEATSFRLRGHSVVDPARYRSKEDNEAARSADPVPLFRDLLIGAGVFDAAQADEIDAAAEQRVTEAVAFADGSPDPTVDQLFDYTYATPVANASTALPGDPVVALS
jgi:pyruvate dehydrogenase E1 component alpha subunit